MPSPRDELLRLAARNTRFLDGLERDAVRDIYAAYERARNELLGIITQRRNALYTRTFTGEERTRLRELARDVTLFRQIDARMATLRNRIGEIAEAAWRRAVDGAGAITQGELDFLLTGLDVGQFFYSLTMVDFTSVELGLQRALAKLMTSQTAVATVLKSGLRVGLLRGESFDDLVKRLLAEDASVFVRGRLSAELGARRNVIAANNEGKDAIYRLWAPQIPGLGKQTVAAIDENTTECCLLVHGQIQPITGLYRLDGQPRFAALMKVPPFHWRCRTSSVAYHADFEKGAKVTTQDMLDAAQAELKAREDGSRQEIHPAHATSRR
jgi:hypothetical protein